MMATSSQRDVESKVYAQYSLKKVAALEKSVAMKLTWLSNQL
jgi:hypothetical protein